MPCGERQCLSVSHLASRGRCCRSQSPAETKKGGETQRKQKERQRKHTEKQQALRRQRRKGSDNTRKGRKIDSHRRRAAAGWGGGAVALRAEADRWPGGLRKCGIVLVEVGGAVDQLLLHQPQVDSVVDLRHRGAKEMMQSCPLYLRAVSFSRQKVVNTLMTAGEGTVLSRGGGGKQTRQRRCVGRTKVSVPARASSLPPPWTRQTGCARGRWPARGNAPGSRCTRRTSENGTARKGSVSSYY